MKGHGSITNQTTTFAKLTLKECITTNQGQSSLRSYSCFFSFRPELFVNSSLIPYLLGSENTGSTQTGKPAACPDITLESQFLNCGFYVTTQAYKMMQGVF